MIFCLGIYATLGSLKVECVYSSELCDILIRTFIQPRAHILIGAFTGPFDSLRVERGCSPELYDILIGMFIQPWAHIFDWGVYPTLGSLRVELYSIWIGIVTRVGMITHF